MRVLLSSLILLSACATEPEPTPGVEVFPWPTGYTAVWSNPTLHTKGHGTAAIECSPERCHFFTRDYWAMVTQESYWTPPRFLFGPLAVEFETGIPSTVVGDDRLRVAMPVAFQDVFGTRRQADLAVDEAGVWRARVEWETDTSITALDLELRPHQ